MTLPLPAKELIDIATRVPENRTQTFFELGQKYMKPLEGRVLEEFLYEVFLYICDSEWKGDLMVPTHYRTNKGKNTPVDIWFTIRDYMAWCFLYPNEVDNYFNIDEQGNTSVKANPKVRIMDKDNKKEVYKTELGVKKLVQVKKDRSVVIESGYSLGQKDDIHTVCLIGLMEKANVHKKKSLIPEISDENKDSEQSKPEKVKKKSIKAKTSTKK